MQFLSVCRRFAFRTTVLVLMTLQLVNISINVADPSPVVEDLSINEIESCVELIVEVFLGNENAIDETQDHEHSSHRTVGHVNFFTSDSPAITMSNEFCIVSIEHCSVLDERFNSFDRTILSPPPKI